MVKINNIFIHIGYAKSASTTLQKQLFNRHPDINNIGIFPTQNVSRDSEYVDENCLYIKDEKLEEFYYNLVMLRSIEYENAGNLDLFNEYIKNYISNEKINIFSNERFTSVFFSHDDVVAKANRLKEIFPSAKIIVVVRNQFNLIKSQYRDHPFNPRELTIGNPVSINDWIKIAFESESVYFLNSLKYYEIIRYYEKLYGKENIGVFLLEELATDIENFSKMLSDFMNINYDFTLKCLLNKQENISVSQKYNKYRRFRRKLPINIEISRIIPNKMKKSILKLLKKGRKKDYSINNYWTDKLNEYYSTSNVKLAEEYNLDLKKYNYSL